MAWLISFTPAPRFWTLLLDHVLTVMKNRMFSALRMVSPWPNLAHTRSPKISPSKDEAALGSDGRLTTFRSWRRCLFVAGLENLAHWDMPDDILSTLTLFRDESLIIASSSLLPSNLTAIVEIHRVCTPLFSFASPCLSLLWWFP